VRVVGVCIAGSDWGREDTGSYVELSARPKLKAEGLGRKETCLHMEL
jgi:hypothetical protein